jgi:hypothetical protein
VELDVGQTAAAMMPYITTVVAAYGTRTLDKVRDALVDKASDATVSIGHRLLNRILGRKESREAIEGAVIDVANNEEDSVSALKLQIRKALASDNELMREVISMLPSDSVHLEASGERAVAVQHNSGVISTGGGATIYTGQAR